MRNLVKINHSAMELVCAKHLIRYGYKVDVEKQLTDILICDVYAEKGDGAAIVEIETGLYSSRARARSAVLLCCKDCKQDSTL